MENEKLRMFLFALISSFCLFYILKSSAPAGNVPTEQIQKQTELSDGVVKSDQTENVNSDVESTTTTEVPQTKDPVENERPIATAPETIENVAYGIPDTVETSEALIKIETDMQIFVFTTKSGALARVDFKNFSKTYEKDSGSYDFIDMQNGFQSYSNTFAVTGLDLLFANAYYEHNLEAKSDGHVLTLRCVKKGIEVLKTFSFKKNQYDFQFHLKVINHRDEEFTADAKFVGATALDVNFEHGFSAYNDQIVTLINDDGDVFAAGDVHFWSGTYGARQGLLSLNEEKFVMGPNRKSGKKHDNAKVVWGAMKNRYFAFIVKPTKDDWTVYGENMNTNMKDKFDVKPRMIFEPSMNKLVKNQFFEEEFKVFVGPMQNGVINSAQYDEDAFVEVIDYGFMFPRFIKFFDWVLNAIISIIGHNQYWLGIILLTMLVRLAMFPITRKSSMSQAKLQAITPKMKALKEKHKGNPKKLNEDMMKLYRDEGVNPFSSCLPMLIQMPIFIGLYWTFTLTFEVRFTSFLWINDLAVADHLFSLGRTLPIIGDHFNLLPILYAVINYLHMSSMPVPQDEMQAQQQKIMRYMFPVMMLLFFYAMPAALVLYFIVSGVWSIAEQKIIKKKIEVLKQTLAKA